MTLMHFWRKGWELSLRIDLLTVLGKSCSVPRIAYGQCKYQTPVLVLVMSIEHQELRRVSMGRGVAKLVWGLNDNEFLWVRLLIAA